MSERSEMEEYYKEYLPPPKREPKAIIEELALKESEYCDKLESILKREVMLQNELTNQVDSFNFGIGFSHFIYSINMYHLANFKPFLLQHRPENHEDLLDFFMKNKYAFRLYEDIFEVEASWRWLQELLPDDFEILDAFYVKEPNKRKRTVLEVHLDDYLAALKELKEQRGNEGLDQDFGRVIRMLEHCKRRIPDEQRILLAEIMAHERRYYKKLRNYVQNHSGDTYFETRRKQLLGNADRILEEQQPLLGDLEMSFFNDDVEEFMRCFLDYRAVFLLYPEGISLMDNGLREHFANTYSTPFLVDPTQEILRLYGEFMRKAKKTFRSSAEAVAVIQEVQEMFTDISTRCNEHLAIKAIRSANIDVFSQGELLKRGDVLVTMQRLKLNQDRLEVFLFRKAMIFTERHIDSNLYHHHILTNNIKWFKYDDSKITFYDRTVDDKQYVLQTTDTSVKDWALAISDTAISWSGHSFQSLSIDINK